MLMDNARRNAMKTLAAGLSVPVASASCASETNQAAADGADLLVTQFGARGDGSADDTAAFEAAIAAAALSGRRLRIPPGRYRITRTLEINRGIQLVGDGVERAVLLAMVGRSRPAILVHAKETDSIIGIRISGFKLICAQGAEPCDGIKLSTGGKGAAIHQAVLRDIFIVNVGTGIALSGVVYRSCFDNITVSGNVGRYGFYCDSDFEDVTYNSFWNLEITNVASGAYAYWIHSNFSNFLNLTSDGCAYFSSPGGTIRNISVEGISAREPASDTVIQLNQVQTIDGVNLIGIDPKKCVYGLKVIGQAVVIRAIRCLSLQPTRLLNLDPASEGVIAGVQTEQPAAMVEDYVPAATLNRWILQGAQAVTRRQLVYAEGDWQPVFEGWTVPPKVEAASWERIGRRVFLSLSARGGVTGKTASIRGFPTPIARTGDVPIAGMSGARVLVAGLAEDGRVLTIPSVGALVGGLWSIEISFRLP